MNRRRIAKSATLAAAVGSLAAITTACVPPDCDVSPDYPNIYDRVAVAVCSTTPSYAVRIAVHNPDTDQTRSITGFWVIRGQVSSVTAPTGWFITAVDVATP